MSMSTQHGGGGTRRPSSTKPGGKPKDEPVGDKPAKAGGAVKPAAKAGGTAKAGAAGKTAAKAGGAKGARPGGGGGKGPRKPITPVKVQQSRPWGAIILFSLVGLLALGIVGFGGWQVYQNGKSFSDRAAEIPGIKNFRKSDPKMLESKHVFGPVKYPVTPPVGGQHNPNWQRCNGDVYPAQIANEHAVHSMEHGAVWITYRPDLPKAQVDKLAKRVRGHDFTLMSPYPGQDKPISLQTWGYQLKVDNADDKRIDQFISALREKATQEPGAVCSSGNYISETGTTPHDLQGTSPNGGMPGQGTP